MTLREPLPALRSLRLALLASLGLPVACGGDAVRAGSGSGGASSSSNSSSSASTSGPNSNTSATTDSSNSTTTSSTTTTGRATSSSGGSGGSGGGAGFTCTNPEPILVQSEDVGFARCEESYEARLEAVECPNGLPPKTPLGEGGAGGLEGYYCDSHTQCPGLEFCDITVFGSFCTPGCLTDSDCPSGMICRCDQPIGRCTPGSCSDGDDCPNSICAGSFFDACGSTLEYSCLSEDDECLSDLDCEDAGEWSACQVIDGKRRCASIPECGRPFLVHGVERAAPVVARKDWLFGNLAPELGSLTRRQRSQLGRYWQEIGRMEHASIAAFARFSLQLLALGAPAEFVESTQRALEDETHHARLAFGLASAYGGRAVGPGALTTHDSLEDSSLRTFVKNTVLEGCVGETLAAAEAQQARAECRDAVVCRVLERIADDEARHAALAWQVVAWVISQHPELVSELRAAFEEARTLPDSADVPGRRSEGLEPLGVLASSTRRELRRRVLDEVIKPCSQALLSLPGTQIPDIARV